MEKHAEYKGTRFPYRVDEAEFDRRQKAALKKMKELGIECIVCQETSLNFGGALQWLGGGPISENHYDRNAIFSENGLALFGHGSVGGSTIFPYWNLFNVVSDKAEPVLRSYSMQMSMVPDDMVSYIKANGFKKIGWAGLSYITGNVYQVMTEKLSECEFVDFSCEMDNLMSIKSDYELELLTEVCHLQDKVMGAVPALLRPGMLERDIATSVIKMWYDLGGTAFFVMTGSDPVKPIYTTFPENQKRIGKDDMFSMLLECPGPHFMWAELGRVFSFKKPEGEIAETAKQVMELQAYAAELCVPGAIPQEVTAIIREKQKKLGSLEELRLDIHGQGYGIVERPVFVPGETMPLQENMFIAIHPILDKPGSWAWNCDDYIITKTGAKRVHKHPIGIVEVD